MNRFGTLGSLLVVGFAFAACDTAAPPPAVQRELTEAEAKRAVDVAEERREGAREIEREQQDVAEESRDVAEATRERNYEVALAKVEGDYKVAKEACNPLSGGAQITCLDRAETSHNSAKARAELLNPKD